MEISHYSDSKFLFLAEGVLFLGVFISEDKWDKLGKEKRMATNKKVFILEEHLQDEALDLFQYTHIRAYHACRPLDMQEYLIKGIQVINKKKSLKESLVRIKSDFVNDKEIEKEFNKHWRALDNIHKRVWLAVNKEILLTDSSHYLIYGSEFINALAMELGCRSSLKETGIPTIFHCDVPVESISLKIIKDIEKLVQMGYVDDITIDVNGVESQDIINYEHPKEIPDPYFYNAKYRPDYMELKEKGYTSIKL